MPLSGQQPPESAISSPLWNVPNSIPRNDGYNEQIFPFILTARIVLDKPQMRKGEATL